MSLLDFWLCMLFPCLHFCVYSTASVLPISFLMLSSAVFPSIALYFKKSFRPLIFLCLPCFWPVLLFGSAFSADRAYYFLCFFVLSFSLLGSVLTFCISVFPYPVFRFRFFMPILIFCKSCSEYSWTFNWCFTCSLHFACKYARFNPIT